MGLKTESRIEVRFRVYQYNSGMGDNGTNDFKKTFPVTEEGIAEAMDFAREVQDAIEKGYEDGHGQGGGEIASKYVWSGFISSFEGIVRVDVLHDEVEHVLG